MTERSFRWLQKRNSVKLIRVGPSQRSVLQNSSRFGNQSCRMNPFTKALISSIDYHNILKPKQTTCSRTQRAGNFTVSQSQSDLDLRVIGRKAASLLSSFHFLHVFLTEPPFVYDAGQRGRKLKCILQKLPPFHLNVSQLYCLPSGAGVIELYLRACCFKNFIQSKIRLGQMK